VIFMSRPLVPRCKFCNLIRNNPTLGKELEDLYFTGKVTLKELYELSKEKGVDIGTVRAIANHLKRHAIYRVRITDEEMFSKELLARMSLLIETLDLYNYVRERIERHIKSEKFTPQWGKLLLDLGSKTIDLVTTIQSLRRDLARSKVSMPKIQQIFFEALREAGISPEQIDTIKKYCIMRMREESEAGRL